VKLKLGMRTLKTGLGIYLAFFICQLLELGGTLAAITAVVGMQPSLKGSIITIKNQLISTLIGCIFAIGIAYYFDGNLIILSIAAIITIWLCLTMGWQDNITLAIITLILVGEAPKGDFIVVVQNRVFNILIGLSVAFVLNIIIPPRHNYRLLEKVDELRHVFDKFSQRCIRDILYTPHLSREEVEENAQKIKDLIEEARYIYVLSIESKFNYDEKKEKDTYFLIRKTINAILFDLEKLLEIHRSILLAPKEDNYQELRQNIYEFLSIIFNRNQNIFNYILYNQKLDNSLVEEFTRKEEQLEEKIVNLVNQAHDLEPMYYYNIVADAQRIMKKAQNLVETKERFAIKTTLPCHPEGDTVQES
jgi:uncharacterized membrane protein YgaE (UPF0421/DUF939 family)